MRNKVNQLLSRLDHARRQVKEEKKTLAEAKEHLTAVTEAQRIVNEVARTVQASAHGQIAATVTRCLQAVFGDDAPEFRILFEKKRGRTEARLVFVQGDHEVDPESGQSGGVLEVAAFALRLSALLLAVPKRRRLLVVDEPFRCLSKQYRPAVRDLLGKLSEELGVQIIMVTHSEEFVTGKVVELGD